MARKRKRRKYTKRKPATTRSTRGRKSGASETSSRNAARDGMQLDLKPETSRAIIAVVLGVLALISLLSLFEAAGAFGVFWKDAISKILGVAVYIMPILFIALAAAVLNLKKFPTKGTTYLGFVLFVISFAGLAHLSVRGPESFDAALAGRGGGFVGYIVSNPLDLLFGFWASLIILLAVIIIALLLFFNSSLQEIVERFKKEKEDEDKKKAEPAVKVNGEDDKKQEKMKIIDFKEKLKHKKPAGDLAVNEMKGEKEEKYTPIETKKSADENWQTPPLNLLDDSLDRPSSGDIKGNAKIIQDTLENFGISVEMGDVSVGPTVTQYTLRPEAGIKLNKIVTLQNDLALALAAHPIRIEAPIPGKSVVGIEIPNVSIAMVRLRELLESKEYGKSTGDLLFPLGRGVDGAPQVVAVEKMPHLLIAGATGSGKSVAINSLLVSLIYHNSPADLKLILVDPKRVELSVYNDIPHLLTPVITDPKKTVNSLKWIVGEMDRRYKLLQSQGVRNIEGFNTKNKDSHLPKIVVVVDELSDLMAVASREVEASVVRLAQMARAVGIHLVLATQRPSVDVITGLIKANIPTRIAFSVTSITDSRTILDSAGAEKLLGNGDMLYMPPELSKPRRIQGAFVSDKEVEKVTDWLKDKAKPEYLDEVTEKQMGVAGVPSSDDEVDDDLYDEAKEAVLDAGKASASYLQRKLRVGYARAARLIDLLEENGVVGPGEGAKPREILIEKGADGSGVGGADEVIDSPDGFDAQDGGEPPLPDAPPPMTQREPDMQDLAEEQERRDRGDSFQ